MTEHEDPNFLYYLELHYFVLKQKFLYYDGVSHGFKPIPDKDYDVIEQEYKRVCDLIGKQPTASNMVGWDKNHPCSLYIEALAMRDSDKKRYEKLKHSIFIFK